MRVSVVVVLLLSSVVVCSGYFVPNVDVELEQCQQLCRQQHQFDEKQKEVCFRQCKDYTKRKEDWGRHHGDRDPEKRVEECRHQCEKARHLDEEQRRDCRSKCEKQYREGGREGSVKGRYYHEVEEEEWMGREGGRKGGENPYVFREEHFVSKSQSQHGRVDVLQKFTDKSELLKGIENFRIGVLEANPQTFVTPTHIDADGVLFVAHGRGTFTMIQEDRGRLTSGEIKRHSFNIETGDVIKVRAGTPVYLVNKDESQKLVIIKFIRPVNTPGSFQAFHGPGGENPESYFRAFSSELLEAAFKVSKEKLQRIFQQEEGVIRKASREQIRALSRGEEGGGIWPFGGESSGPFNLLHRRPTQRNTYGQLWEACPEEFEQLRDLDLMVSFANITRGAMAGPFYNSRATKIAYVVDGEGYFEMACPHVSGGSSRQQGRGPSYEKVQSRLSRGTVFVVPAGHPVATVASGNNNLQVVCFEVNAEGNSKFALAGKDNVMSKIEREALELGFGVPARQVEEIFNKQNEEFFFPGPQWQQQQQRERGKKGYSDV